MRELLKWGYVITKPEDKPIVMSVSRRLSDLRMNKKQLCIAHDPELHRTVLAVPRGVVVVVESKRRLNFGGRLIRYILTGKD